MYHSTLQHLFRSGHFSPYDLLSKCIKEGMFEMNIKINAKSEGGAYSLWTLIGQYYMWYYTTVLYVIIHTVLYDNTICGTLCCTLQGCVRKSSTWLTAVCLCLGSVLLLALTNDGIFFVTNVGLSACVKLNYFNNQSCLILQLYLLGYRFNTLNLI